MSGWCVPAVAPQYRQSDGGDSRDEMGGADVADVVNAVHSAGRTNSTSSPGEPRAHRVRLARDSLLVAWFRDHTRQRLGEVCRQPTECQASVHSDSDARVLPRSMSGTMCNSSVVTHSNSSA